MSKKITNVCNGPGGLPQEPVTDQPPGYCDNDGQPNLKNPNDASLDWLKDVKKFKGFGNSANCDPMQSGAIYNDVENPNRDVIYRYSKALRGADEAMLDLFSNIIVFDSDDKPHKVPLIMGPQEKAVAMLFFDNVRKDNTNVVNRIRLPMMALHQSGEQEALNRYTYHRAINYFRYLREDHKPGMTVSEKWDRDTVFGVARGNPVDLKYTLYVWTKYDEDMNQIREQIRNKFSNVAYIRVAGVPWEVPVKLDSVANSVNFEPGDQDIKVIKYQYEFTVESYIPMPISRKKAVLSTKIEFVDGLTEDEITQVLMRMEEKVKELEC